MEGPLSWKWGDERDFGLNKDCCLDKKIDCQKPRFESLLILAVDAVGAGHHYL